MKFNDSQAIYLQIAYFIEEKILRTEWNVGERVPSVRDMAVAMEVNPNTVVRTYELLQQKEIIYNKRGIGYFVSEDACSMVLKERREHFSTHELPNFFKNIQLLDFSWEEITSLYQSYLQQTKNEENETFQ